MLRTLPVSRDWSPAYRIASIALFTLITILAARIVIPLEPVPFTMQPFAVLLAGMILGRRDGALSQLAYVGLIAVGLPFDARGLGQAALIGPTGGFLVGFIAAAFVTGWLVELGAKRVWQRWIAGIVGVAVIYAVGVPWLAVNRAMGLDAAFAAGAAPFIPLDVIKAVIAAGLTEGGRRLLQR